MAETTVTSGTRRRMTWEQYWQLPEDLRAEYSDGEVLVNPPPSVQHQQICRRLANILDAQLSGAVVVEGAGWKLSEHRPRLRIPDIVVLREQPAGAVVTEPPLVAVEVLSTNGSNDLVRKAIEYRDAGAGQYWIVDTRDRVVDVFVRGGNGWDQAATINEQTPAATVDVPPFGQVTLVLDAILG